MRVPAVILAGGKGSRMGGADKALLPLAGRRMVDAVAARIAPQASRLAVNVRAGNDLSGLGLPLLPDQVGGQPGPLAGVLAAMDWAAGLGAERVATVPVDVPVLPGDLVARLGGTPGLAVAATAGGRVHPVVALWPVALREGLRAALAAGVRRVADFQSGAGAVEVPFAEAFFNVNTIDDLALAERLLAPVSRFPIWGVTGWKNSGKTTLMERLVADLTARGLRIATVKHAHHAAEIDHPGRDSHRHREAGASQVILSTPVRWALVGELRGAETPGLPELIAHLDPCDLVLVEGWKAEGHPKIEVHRPSTGHRLMAPGNPTIRAVASDAALPGISVPVLDLNKPASVAEFILRTLR